MHDDYAKLHGLVIHRLPADARRGEGERIVVVPRVLITSAKPDIP